MKKFKTLLLGLAGMAFAAPNASAQNMIGRVLAPEELENGTEVVFEARSGTDSKGHYLIPWVDASGTRNPCRALGSILDVTDDMVWVLEKSGKSNEVTGLAQWFIKNKKTGKYITFEWNASSGTQEEKDKDPDRWIDKWTNGRCGSVAPDTAHAKRFCIVSNNDEQWRGDYGSAGYGSSQSDWGFDTYTIVNIFDKTGCKNNQNDGCGYGRVELQHHMVFAVSGHQRVGHTPRG